MMLSLIWDTSFKTKEVFSVKKKKEAVIILSLLVAVVVHIGHNR